MFWKLPTIILGVVILSLAFTPGVNAGLLEWLQGLFGASVITADLGSERIESNGVNYTHIWNNGSIATDYFYNGNCNQKLSNQVNESWESVIYGMTYGGSKEALLQNYVQLHNGDCNILNSSTEDLVNFTAWKDVTFLGKTGRLAKESTIELNDDYMKETFKFKSDSIINQDVWFVIKRQDLDVSYNQNDNFLKIKSKVTNATLIRNLSVDFTEYASQDDIYQTMFITDAETSESITFFSETNADYYYIIKNGEVYTMYNSGTYTAGQIKTLPTFWVDARCTCGGAITSCALNANYPDGTSTDVGSTFRMDLSPIVNGGGFCTGCLLEWQDNYDGSYNNIPVSDTDLDCTGAVCTVVSSNSGFTYSKTLTCEGVSSGVTRGLWTITGGICAGTYTQLTATSCISVISPVCTNSYSGGDFLVPVSTEVNCTAEVFEVDGMIEVNGTLNLYDATNCTYDDDVANWVDASQGGVIWIYNNSQLI